ncbi:MAG: N-acetylmuramoyl-L-alanine amidase, partial [Lachnospiraceae bacterium]|nr:N-acetylmuramoyl-L-alanine amidase [Lachnospiraceae bacterium]
EDDKVSEENSGAPTDGSLPGTDTKESEDASLETGGEVNEGVMGFNDSMAAASSHADQEQIGLDKSWKYADYSMINSGSAVFYAAKGQRKGKIIGVNAGHGTKGGSSVKTYCHPDKSPKVTGGSTKAGATMATAVSGGMTFNDGTSEASVTLKMAKFFKEELLSRGYDVLMVRDGDDVQLDNVARTVICNNVADCHIALHWDGDGLDYDKGCFYISVADGIKNMDPVSSHWQQHDQLGEALVNGLRGANFKIFKNGSNPGDLTQTSYSTVPSVDIELGNQTSDHSDANLKAIAVALANGVESFF